MSRRRAAARAGLVSGSSLLLTSLLSTLAGASAAPGSATTPDPQLALSVPPGAQPAGAVPGTQQVSGELALAPADPAGLDAFVGGVSSPGSPAYHHFLPAGQFGQRFGASASTLDAVRSWLSASGFIVTSTDPNGLYVGFSGPASAVSSGLGMSVQQYRRQGAAGYAASGTPLVPQALHSSIRGLVGLSDLPTVHDHLERPSSAPPAASPQPAAPRSTSPATSRATTVHACAAAQSDAQTYGGYTADQLQNAYGVSQTGLAGAGTTIAVVEFEPYSSNDVAAYQACYGSSATVTEETVATPQANPPPCNETTTTWQTYGCGEAALDIEQVIAMAPQASIKVYEGSNATPASVLAVYQKIASEDVAKVVSTSWGGCEQLGVTSSDASSQAVVFSQMAAQGQSVFAAAGDSGSEDCYSYSTSLYVDDPASQPDVTGVGGTSLTSVSPRAESVWNNCDGGLPTCAATASANGGGAGGGGDSQLWRTPSWQSSTVGAPACGCREVPDVSGSADLGYPSTFYWDAGWTVFGGTSAATPMWAGITALLDESTAASGLGNANPLLYAAGQCANGAFNDITSGNNDFTDTNNGAYPAGGGFDRASGWGSPDTPVLLADVAAGGCTSAPTPNRTAPSAKGLPTVAVLGPGNTVMVYWESADAQWHGPYGIGTGYGPPSVAVSSGTGLPTVAVQGPGNSVWVYWEAANAQWYGPLGVGTGYGAPSISVSPTGLPTVAVQGPGNGLWVYWEAANAQWYGPLGVGTGYGAPSISVSPSGLPTVAVQGPGNGLWVYWEAANAQWYGPLGIGGAGAAASAPSVSLS